MDRSRLPTGYLFLLPLLIWKGQCASLADPAFTLTLLHRGDNGTYAMGDMDGDGRKDIVIARKPQPLQWLSYPSMERHLIAGNGNVWMEIQAGDVDGDGDCDVIAPEMTSFEVLWWENPGKGPAPESPWASHRIGAWDGGFPHDFKLGDIDGNGRLDAVFRSQGSPVFLVFLQDRTGAWNAVRTSQAFGNGEGTALGDIDGDGDLDISDGLVWLETPPDPSHQAWARHEFNADYGSPRTRVSIADMNHDGRSDIIVSPSDVPQTLEVAWFEAADPKTGPWTKHIVIPAGRTPFIHTLQVGDINRDGHMDLLSGSDHRGSKEMLIYYGADGGRGESWREQAWPTDFGVWQAILADVDADGDLDILSADDDNGSQQELWINSASGASIMRPAEPQSRKRINPFQGFRLYRHADREFDASGRRRSAHQGSFRVIKVAEKF